MNLKKCLSALGIGICALALVGCGGEKAKGGAENAAWDMKKEIHLISREDGSGTRGAFVELLGILVKENGKKVDRTSVQAQITNSTNVMMTTVGNDPYSIGYISLGSMKDSLRAVHIDGVAATAENVQNGTYPLARPFHVVYAQGKALSAQSADFLKFIHSAEGQKIVQDNGYVQVDKGAPAYQAINAEGKIVVAGSSSITPVMEKLAEAYQKYNPNLKIEVQQSDSTTGVQAAIQGTADLGMASRHLKASEQDKVQADVIARDGLAVIVHPQNKVTNLSRDAVRDIYIGKIKSWQEVAK